MAAGGIGATVVEEAVEVRSWPGGEEEAGEVRVWPVVVLAVVVVPPVPRPWPEPWRGEPCPLDPAGPVAPEVVLPVATVAEVAPVGVVA